MFDEKCSCDKRDCVKESSSGCGKMCVGITHTTLSLGLNVEHPIDVDELLFPKGKSSLEIDQIDWELWEKE